MNKISKHNCTNKTNYNHGFHTYQKRKPVKVTDIYDKKGGALEFLVQEYTAKNQDDVLVAEMRRTIVVRN